MDRRTKICIWIIMIGLANFLIYTILYLHIDGEAIHGHVERFGDGSLHYFIQSDKGTDVEVSSGTFIYSGLHSISIWVTVGAVMLAMLTLAKERIASSMRSAIVRGRTLITILATVITMIIVMLTIRFSLRFGRHLNTPLETKPVPDPPAVVQ